MNNNFIRLAGDTQHWDDEITRRVAAGEDLCRLQEEQSARGYLPYRLVLSMYGWTIRYASGLQGFGLVYSSRSFNPADALAEGEATGATLYTLSEDASDAASAALAERHDRDDLLAGVDLTAQDDLVATVLMDMARAETTPKLDRLAKELETSIKAADLKMHRIPHQTAGLDRKSVV